MKKCLAVLLGLYLVACMGCNLGSAEDTTKADEPKPTSIEDSQPSKEPVKEDEPEAIITETPKPEEPFRFVDAHGNWYETTINPNLNLHNYNWEYLTNDNSGISYEDQNYRIRKGIDVSHHQGDIDWDKVKASGYEFVIIRIGYRGYGQTGSLNQDRTFYTNIQEAQAVGLDVGVYFFAQAINEEEALEEANFVLDMLEGYSLQLPITYDPELIRDDEARTDNVTGEQFTKNTIVFCERIKDAGYEPMIYSNMVWEAELFDMEQLQEYPFWYADYEKIPQTPYDFSFWQYTETGKVDGIEGNVDLNIQFVAK